MPVARTGSTACQADDLPAEHWVLALDLAMRWHFDAIRDVALEQLMGGLSHDSRTLALQLAAAHRHKLAEYYWRVFTLLVERSSPLSPKEGEQLGVGLVLCVAAVREKLRCPTQDGTIFGSTMRIQLTDDQQRMIWAEFGLATSEELGPALDLYRPIYVTNDDSNPSCLSVYT